MKKFPGNTLIEILMALCVLGIVVPTSLGSLGNVLAAELKFHVNSYAISSAEWWFSRLTLPVSRAEIDAAPRMDRHGKVRFDWDSKDLNNGAISVTLRVYANYAAPIFTVSRIF